uniref:Gamma-interferon-inducible lysosomal thiol reductase-like n=1 Tax=Hirondellea gigas TaxID=1518452 RepID=A0A2P2IBH2_9CRUS
MKLTYECVAVFILSWLLAAVSGEIDNEGESGQVVDGPSPVRVTVYFEALCPDSRRLFRKQLGPTYRQLRDIMQLEYVPFGKAVATPRLSNGRITIDFECQHGPRECLGNRIMSCAENLLSVTDQHSLFMCIMTASYPVAAAEQCSKDLNIDWSTIQRCTKSRLGAVLLYMNGRKTATLRPHLYYVPTITINGKYSRATLPRSTSALKRQICEAYRADHPNC